MRVSIEESKLGNQLWLAMKVSNVDRFEDPKITKRNSLESERSCSLIHRSSSTRRQYWPHSLPSYYLIQIRPLALLTAVLYCRPCIAHIAKHCYRIASMIASRKSINCINCAFSSLIQQNFSLQKLYGLGSIGDDRHSPTAPSSFFIIYK